MTREASHYNKKKVTGGKGFGSYIPSPEEYASMIAEHLSWMLSQTDIITTPWKKRLWYAFIRSELDPLTLRAYNILSYCSLESIKNNRLYLITYLAVCCQSWISPSTAIHIVDHWIGKLSGNVKREDDISFDFSIIDKQISHIDLHIGIDATQEEVQKYVHDNWAIMQHLLIDPPKNRVSKLSSRQIIVRLLINSTDLSAEAIMNIVNDIYDSNESLAEQVEKFYDANIVTKAKSELKKEFTEDWFNEASETFVQSFEGGKSSCKAHHVEQLVYYLTPDKDKGQPINRLEKYELSLAKSNPNRQFTITSIKD